MGFGEGAAPSSAAGSLCRSWALGTGKVHPGPPVFCSPYVSPAGANPLRLNCRLYAAGLRHLVCCRLVPELAQNFLWTSGGMLSASVVCSVFLWYYDMLILRLTPEGVDMVLFN
jgi:hypothetical protein